MAKAKKTVATKAAPRKAGARKAGRRVAAAPARPTVPSARGLAPEAVSGLARQLSEITRTLRDQQRAIEHLVALHEAAAADSTLAAEPNDTVGAIPRISLVPPRAA